MEKRKEEALFFFFFFSFQNGRRTHFPKQPAGLFFQDGCQFFVLMGPTWTRDMTSVYLGLDLEKDRIFLCFFNSKKKEKKSRRPQKRKRAGTLNMFVFLLRLRDASLENTGPSFELRNSNYAKLRTHVGQNTIILMTVTRMIIQIVHYICKFMLSWKPSYM